MNVAMVLTGVTQIHIHPWSVPLSGGRAAQ
jgi:hypothetical protein